MSEKKVIIIGAGLGGLTTGAILACNGLRVTVVERNARIGGGLQSYNRFGATFDTGMHVISGMGEGENIRCMCDYLGISDQFENVSLDPDSDVEIYVREEGRRYPVNFRRAHIADSFAAYFPQQRDSIERYVRAMDEMMSKFDLFYMRPNSRTI